MPVPKQLYVLYCGVYSREAKAVALAESNEDPLAISPGGLGIGILQQSIPWQHDYPPTDPAAVWWNPFALGIGATRSAMLYQHAISGGPWHPAYQLACYATFCSKHSTIDMAARWRLYHYGHAQDIDPDGYVQRVMVLYGTLTNW